MLKNPLVRNGIIIAVIVVIVIAAKMFLPTDAGSLQVGQCFDPPTTEGKVTGVDEAGLLVWPNVGQADGVNGDLAMLAPPFVVTEEQVDEIVHLMGLALQGMGERVEAAT